jgi:AcrR family transcriptional regulator
VTLGIKERRQKEKELRRQQIQEAARAFFSEKGFVGTTIENIANRAELSPATIYQYFKDKDDLYAQLNIESLTALLKRIERVSKNKKYNHEQKIHGFKNAMIWAFKSDPRLFKNTLQFQLISDFKNLEAEPLGRINTLYRNILSIIAKTYQDGVQEGVFRDGLHPVAYADIVFSTFIGIMLWEDTKKRMDPKKDFFKSTLDKAFDMIIEGIKVPPGT